MNSVFKRHAWIGSHRIASLARLNISVSFHACMQKRVFVLLSCMLLSFVLFINNNCCHRQGTGYCIVSAVSFGAPAVLFVF